MARLLFLLAFVFLINGGDAVSFQEDIKSCDQVYNYSGHDASFYSAVDAAVAKAFPKGDFTPSCLNAQITPINKSSATVTVVYVAECTWSSNDKPTDYQCINENSDHIGNRYYEMTGTVECLGKTNGNSNCVTVSSIKDVTPKAAPASPPAVGVWIPTPDLFIPKDIQNAGLAYMMKNAKVATVAPAEGSNKAYYGPSSLALFGFSRKVDANGGVTYRIPGIIHTKSAAKGCSMPILSSKTTVDVKKTGGNYSFSNLTDEEYGKALREDSGMQPKCVGQAAWKAGVAKVDKFCSSVKGGCSRMDVSDRK